MKKLFIILILATKISTQIFAQQTIELELPVAEKLNSMAWKSRYLDTVAYNYYTDNKLIFAELQKCQSAFAALDQLYFNLQNSFDATTLLNEKLEKQNAILLRDSNICLTTQDKLEKKITVLEQKNKQLKSRSTSSGIMAAIFGLAALTLTINAINN